MRPILLALLLLLPCVSRADLYSYFGTITNDTLPVQIDVATDAAGDFGHGNLVYADISGMRTGSGVFPASSCAPPIFSGSPLSFFVSERCGIFSINMGGTLGCRLRHRHLELQSGSVPDLERDVHPHGVRELCGSRAL